MSVQITFLNHSGFAVETDSKVLVFDYYKDPSGTVKAYSQVGRKPLWFFVSHWHEDHFNRSIGQFGGAQYIVNEDVRLKDIPADRFHAMKLYETLPLGDTTVTQYGSTDEGGSFLVETDGLKIFHAGDLNWWHWLGDTDENNAEAKGNFDREMKHLAGQTFDIRLFPCRRPPGRRPRMGRHGFPERRFGHEMPHPHALFRHALDAVGSF
jgi:L-ascorbate metabolism protein UlaG (beta-lactamase superfamily)